MDLLCTESCTSLLFPGSPKLKRPPCSGGPPVQKHLSTESHVSECPTEAELEELKKTLWSGRMSICVAQGVMGRELPAAISHPFLPSGKIWSIKHYFKSLGPVTSSRVKII